MHSETAHHELWRTVRDGTGTHLFRARDVRSGVQPWQPHAWSPERIHIAEDPNLRSQARHLVRAHCRAAGRPVRGSLHRQAIPTNPSPPYPACPRLRRRKPDEWHPVLVNGAGSGSGMYTIQLAGPARRRRGQRRDAGVHVLARRRLCMRGLHEEQASVACPRDVGDVAVPSGDVRYADGGGLDTRIRARIVSAVTLSHIPSATDGRGLWHSPSVSDDSDTPLSRL